MPTKKIMNIMRPKCVSTHIEYNCGIVLLTQGIC